MGARHSLYESPGPLKYNKLSMEDHALVKNLWSEIENNPQFYGTAFFSSLVAAHPQYIKFFTLEQYRPLHLDVRTTSKFTVIMEAMGFLFLDFYSKPKQLDRLVGYIAMVHKDMKLEKQDMFNFGYHLLGFINETFPSKMTMQVREIISKFLVSILLEIARKMDYFRNCEMAHLGIEARPSRLKCKDCTIFGDQLIFGHTKTYWLDWKHQWENRIKHWSMESTKSIQTGLASSSDEDEESMQIFKSNDETQDSTDNQGHHRISTQSRPIVWNTEIRYSKAALTQLTRRLESDIDSTNSKFIAEDRSARSQEDNQTRSTQARTNARERHRAKALVKEVGKSEYDGTIVHKKIRNTRNNPAEVHNESKIPMEQAENESDELEYRTARGRRRGSIAFSYDLK